MRWQLSSLRTRVAQQLLMLFVACALAPLCTFAALASWMVANETRQQTLRRLRTDTKVIAMGALDRLARAESRLRMCAEFVAMASAEHRDRAAQFADSFEAVWFIDETGNSMTLKGTAHPRAFSSDQQLRLAGGRTVATILIPDGAQGPQLELAVPVGSSPSRRAHIVALTDARVLWDLVDDATRPPDVDVCVLDDHQATLACSAGSREPLKGLTTGLGSGSGALTWRAEEEMLGAYWSAPLMVEQLHYGGLLHDIGKLGVPAHILDKDGPLTAEELRIVQLHPELGARILEPIAAYAPMLPVVLEHHERFDGSGYPRGLAGDAISVPGRIFAVADVVDALSSDRPYRPGLPFPDVVQYVKDQAGRQFDPAIVDAFLRIAAHPSSELHNASTTAVPDHLNAEAVSNHLYSGATIATE